MTKQSGHERFGRHLRRLAGVDTSWTEMVRYASPYLGEKEGLGGPAVLGRWQDF